MPLPARLQDLLPEAARFCLGVERFMAAQAGLDLSGKGVVAGLSGGADSTALVLALHWLSPRLGCCLTAAHLDHGLRPESAAEARSAQDLCRGLGIPCRVERVDAAALARQQGLGLEEAARQARYAFLERVRVQAKARWIVVGHQLNDLAEDVVMRLVRGTGWPGLGGMAAVDPARCLARPLLLTARADILAFLAAVGATWTEDPSNADRSFLRNRVRHDILPLLEQENPNFSEAVAVLWQLAGLDREWFGQLLAALPWGQDQAGAWTLPLDALRALPRALRLRALKHGLERLGPGQALAANLLALDQAVMSGQGGKTVQFPGRRTVEIKAGLVRFCLGPGQG